MSGLTRRTQILLDEERYARLEARASAGNQSVAAVIREAIDEKLANEADDSLRRRAVQALLSSDPPTYAQEPDWAVTKRQMRDAAGGR